MKNFNLTLLGVVVFLAASAQQSYASDGKPLIALELELQENTLDGCTSCGCSVKAALEPGDKGKWWMSFGRAVPDENGAWKSAGSSSYCGTGTHRKIAANISRTAGTPYLIVDFSVSTGSKPSDGLNLETKLTIRTLAGFNKKGKPSYTRNKLIRLMTLDAEAEMVLPLLIPDQHERAEFKIHELVFRLRTTMLKNEALEYGSLSISSDVPGAEILLNGGFVGRTEEEQAIILNNVPVGNNDVQIRYFSGHESAEQVLIEPGKIAVVEIDVLGLQSKEFSDGLISIGTNHQGFEEYWRTLDGAVVVKIPAGKFLMGSPEGQGEAHEQPQREVFVSEFLIDKTEVTWRQYKKFAEAEGKSLPPEPLWGALGNYPVSSTIWSEAQNYCRWAGGRLPSEAEWEKSARGVDGRVYSWGDKWNPTRCNSIAGGEHRPEAVGSFPNCVSPYGVLDMSGSLWEWIDDYYDKNYYIQNEAENPRGPEFGQERVKRGSNWMNHPMTFKVAFRAKSSPTWRNVHHGFRCMQDSSEPG
jgi:formylglycine-generating enzyme required for sulfatase activity